MNDTLEIPYSTSLAQRYELLKLGFNYVHCIAALMRSAPPTYCTQSSMPATSIAYSPNGKLFAAGYQNGVLQLWKGTAIK